MFLLFLLLDLLLKKIFFICGLFPSPPGDSENSRNHLEAANFSEAAGSGRHLQDGSFCKRKWQRKGHEDNRDHSFMGRNYDESLAALIRSLFFNGTLIVVSKDVAGSVVLSGKLLIPWLYPSSAHHLLDKADSQLLSSWIVVAFCIMPQLFCYHLVML